MTAEAILDSVCVRGLIVANYLSGKDLRKPDIIIEDFQSQINEILPELNMDGRIILAWINICQLVELGQIENCRKMVGFVKENIDSTQLSTPEKSLIVCSINRRTSCLAEIRGFHLQGEFVSQDDLKQDGIRDPIMNLAKALDSHIRYT